MTAKLYEQMCDLPAAPARAAAGGSLAAAQAGAQELDATIRRNLEALGYGE